MINLLPSLGHIEETTGLKYSTIRRFWSRVDKRGTCWIWRGSCDGDGYGTIMVKRTTLKVHRLSWQFRFGVIPKQMQVLHRCDTPACVNPSHLFLGTHQDNMTDKSRKDRAAKMMGMSNPRAKLTESQVREIRHLRKSGASGPELGRVFGVSHVLIYLIDKRLAWSDLP